MKEFNLSEKRFFKDPYDVLEIKDVKEFIRVTEKEIKEFTCTYGFLNGISAKKTGRLAGNIRKIIEKRAGEELI